MTLKKRCNAQSASMRNLFDRWERKPNQTISHNEFFDTMRMANLGELLVRSTRLEEVSSWLSLSVHDSTAAH